MNISQILQTAVQSQASDLHILAGSQPIMRVDGGLIPMAQQPRLTKEQTQEFAFSLLNSKQKDLLLTNKELDFSFDFGDLARFRINAYSEKGTFALALRLVPSEIRSIEELNLPKIYRHFTKLKHGFVLVTGPTGCGKSSTLAAIIEEINKTRREHIVTIEDPIEFVFEKQQSIISQRQLNSDTYSWKAALKSALREDPDVVMVGEMRDYETIAAALTIAETGHLVFATLHTNSAAQTIDRIVDVFPQQKQEQIKMQLSNSLEAVLAQRLVPAIGGGRVPASEVLLANSAVRNTIREGKTHLIKNIMQTSQDEGMMTMEKSLTYWVKRGKVSLETALYWSLRPGELKEILEKQSAGNG